MLFAVKIPYTMQPPQRSICLRFDGLAQFHPRRTMPRDATNIWDIRRTDASGATASLQIDESMSHLMQQGAEEEFDQMPSPDSLRVQFFDEDDRSGAANDCHT